ncbi:MAG: site-specific integrase, partial [Acidobacteriota bacterium]
KPIVIAALQTGGRRREILQLPWEDVDLERGVLYFDQTNTKSGKQREVPISPALAAELRERRKVRAIGGDAREYVFTRHGKRLGSITSSFETARRRAGLGEDVTFHTLRHTFASWYMINGGDLYRLQKYLGHSTIALTQRYAHLSPAHLKAGVQFFGAPGAGRSHPVDTAVGS